MYRFSFINSQIIITHCIHGSILWMSAYGKFHTNQLYKQCNASYSTYIVQINTFTMIFLLQLEEIVQKLTLNLFSSCSMTWCVVILLEIRTLVGVPKDGVKIEVCRTQWEAGELQYRWQWGIYMERRVELYRKRKIKDRWWIDEN